MTMPRARIRLEIHGSLATRDGAHKLLIALPSDCMTVTAFLLSLHQRYLESECSQLLCSVGGFALPPSELIPNVLRSEDALFVGPAFEMTGLAKRRRLGVAAVGDDSLSEGVPCYDPQEGGKGLFAALSVCGAVFVPSADEGLQLPPPDYAAWRELWQHATSDFEAFKARPPARIHQLRFSQGEDLLRTLSGESKEHTPDVRYNFGVGQTALRANSKSWKDLRWIPDSFKSMLQTLSRLVAVELSQLTELEKEPKGTLGANVLTDSESWAGSRLRHSLYPSNGSCTEHTDYGILTLQQSNGPGLEAFIRGSWQTLEPPPGFVVLFAGDMLEILTNGSVRALRHRVCSHAMTAGADEKCARQSNILFLQPDNDTLVQPLAPYIRGDQHDLAAVRYGDWHRKKTSLAFRKP